jgi:DNA-binding transcriptional MerR regulator
MPAVADLVAIPDKRAADLARITMRQLRYWDQIGLVSPSIKKRISARNTVRLYDSRDLLALLAAAQLRHRPGISLQHIRRIVAHLREQGFDSPLTELRFAIHGSQVYFQYPDGSWSGEVAPDQVVFHQVIELEYLRARIASLDEREADARGKVVRRRGVLGSAPIFAGTRIPVATVQRYLETGYKPKDIIKEYPALTLADIEAARHYSAA